MTNDVLSFVLARSPERVCPEKGDSGIRLARWLIGSQFFQDLSAAEPDDRRGVIGEWADHPDRLPGAVTEIADLALPHADELAALDAWLACRGNIAVPADVEQAILKIFDREVSQGSTDGAFGKDDPLYGDARKLAEWMLGAAGFGVTIDTQRVLVRAILILGLVELMLLARASVRDSERVGRLLRERLILLPKPIFPLPHRAKVVRSPGYADLYVVRQEWARYVAGEIAHVENVLPYELKRRVHSRSDETETTDTTETETTTTDQRDSQSTDRFELTDASNSETSLAVHVEAQVDISGQYGPTKVDSHLGGSLDFSREEAEAHAQTTAREIVTSAVHRVEERVLNRRTVRQLTRVRDKDVHQLDNPEDAPVVGMYRWIDKVIRLQRYRYPHRYLLEFQIPEPASYVRWLTRKAGSTGFRIPKPPPFTNTGLPDDPASRPLLPTDVSLDPDSPTYYLKLMTRWDAEGIEPPPAATVTATGFLHLPSSDPGTDKTSHDVYVTPAQGAPPAAGSSNAPDGRAVIVPEGYLADSSWKGWLTTWDQDDAVPPGFNAQRVAKNKDAPYTYELVPPAFFVTVGDSQNDPAATGQARNLATSARSAISTPIGGQLNGLRTGTLPITVMVQNFGFFSLQVEVTCLRQTGAVSAWQRTTFSKLRAAYFELLRAHEAEADARSVQTGVEISGESPLRNARRVREELKRQTVELLIGSPFAGFDTRTPPASPGAPPATDLGKAQQLGAYVQFLEQAFEWENMSYVMYPYFWTAAPGWPDLLTEQSADPQYEEFLRSGSARVVLSVRPGYEGAADWFMCTGFPWAGKQAPKPDDPNYISIADEIAQQTGAPDDGIATGHSWEVRLPTTLLTLDPDPVLPKVNSEMTLPDPPKTISRIGG
ncbi:MAG: hypothetical protein JWO93_2320 [Micrococcaceae bacterium]|nr:hypothetical protein [Micrococcaceae bacterium]